MVASLGEIPAHIESPDNIQLKVSTVDDSRIGAFCVHAIQKDVEFGPFVGNVVNSRDQEGVEPTLSWEVFDLDSLEYLHTLDATDPHHGNWMRYVCCARYYEEQNIVSFQHGQQVHYKALKSIEPGEELLTWFQPKKKKKRKHSLQPQPKVVKEEVEQELEDSPKPDKSPEMLKRKRKPKIIPDAYEGPLDLDIRKSVNKPAAKSRDDDLFEPLKPGQRRRRRKKLSTDTTDSTPPSKATTPDRDLEDVPKYDVNETDGRTESEEITESKSTEDLNESSSSKGSEAKEESVEKDNVDHLIAKKDIKKETVPAMSRSISDINNSVEWDFPAKGTEYVFELKQFHITSHSDKKIYKCDICLGLYKHMFSLKRHYLRNHINYKYLSKADMTNCLINLAQVKQNVSERLAESQDKTAEDYSDKKSNDEKDIAIETELPENVANDTFEKVFEETINISSANIQVDKTNHNERPGVSKTNTDKNINETNCNKHYPDKNGADIEASVTHADKDDDDDVNLVSKTFPGLDTVRLEAVEKKVTNGDSSLAMVDDNAIEMADDEKVNTLIGEDKDNISMETDNSDELNNKSETFNKTQTKETDINLTTGKAGKSMPGLFQCYTCYSLFNDVDSVREHVQNHPESVEGSCFPCDECNMRFNYKQNLVRHKKVHQVEVDSKPRSVGRPKLSLLPKVKKEKKTDFAVPLKEEPSVPTTSPVKSTSTVELSRPPVKCRTLAEDTACVDKYREYRCGMCRVKFDSLLNMKEHVQATHKTGSKFQCQYCGKDFLSLPNMKKHVRFHLGYRVSCRFCTEVFPNVGCLRKHTRIFHPDIYKAKQLDKIARDGALRRTDKKGKSKTIGEILKKDSSTINKLDKSVTKPKQKLLLIKPAEEIKQEPKPEEDFVSDHEISFAADEIDDGGSRFKFSCTVCKKRFSTYINMCRHRRRNHGNDSKVKRVEGLTFGRKEKNSSPVILEDPAEVALFYANVSHNIATNLNCYIDGKPESLEKFVDHIKIEDYSGNFGYRQENDKPLDFTWESYNFPPDFKLAKTISCSETKKVLDIHSDSDSNCSSEELQKTKKSDQNIVKPDQENTETKVDSVKGVNTLVKDIDTHTCNNNIEESDNCDINTAGLVTKTDNRNTSSDIQSVNSSTETMGKSITGKKALASVVLPRAQKNVQNDKGSALGSRFVKLRIIDGAISNCSSPATKHFNQVINGEYANFEDDILPSDVDSPIIERSSSVSSSRSAGGRFKGQRTAEVVTKENAVNVVEENATDLAKNAQDEISALYDDIENDDSMAIDTPRCTSPKPLSFLCERLLGLGPLANKSTKLSENGSANGNSPLTDKLSLSANKIEAISKLTNEKTVVPDYSDAADDSPFYNYDSIAFGKQGQITQVCAVCKKHFPDFDGLTRHHWKKHPASVCNYLEVEQGHEIESLHYTQPSYVGALAVTDLGLDNISGMDSFTCTRCGSVFKTVMKLHAHIINCAPIDPIYGVTKQDKSPSKTPLKKKIHKKLQHMIHSQHARLKLLEAKYLKESEKIKPQKRIFTGCRKRTSVILPDSPVKNAVLTKMTTEVTTGYNPQNHVRRRELTELVDSLTCEGCGLKFKTIILLERHVKHCTEKEKFKNVRPMTCPIMDESMASLKNVCFYCDKNFTYMKSLLNHFQDFCLVKKSKISKGELTEEERKKEKLIVEKLRQEDEKVVKDKQQTESDLINKPSWQAGRKTKRKGHAWTYIKKKKPESESTTLNNSEGGNEGDADVATADDEVDNVVLDNVSNASEIDSLKSISDFSDSLDNAEDQIEEQENIDMLVDVKEKTLQENNNVSIKLNEENIDIRNVVEHKIEITSCEMNGLKEERELNGFDEVDSGTDLIELETDKEAVVSVKGLGLGAVLDKSEISSKQDDIKYKNMRDFGASDGADEILEIRGKESNNTSLNCTSRYQVNKINIPKQTKRKTQKDTKTDKPKALLMFQCVSQPILYGSEKSGKTDSYEKDTRSENSISDFGSQIIRSKRKRERVSKVEDFLRNAFRRKRKKNSDKTEEPLGQKDIQDVKQHVQKCDVIEENDVCIKAINSENSSHVKNDVDIQKVCSLECVKDTADVGKDLENVVPSNQLVCTTSENTIGHNVGDDILIFELPLESTPKQPRKQSSRILPCDHHINDINKTEGETDCPTKDTVHGVNNDTLFVTKGHNDLSANTLNETTEKAIDVAKIEDSCQSERSVDRQQDILECEDKPVVSSDREPVNITDIEDREELCGSNESETAAEKDQCEDKNDQLEKSDSVSDNSETVQYSDSDTNNEQVEEVSVENVSESNKNTSDIEAAHEPIPETITEPPIPETMAESNSHTKKTEESARQSNLYDMDRKDKEDDVETLTKEDEEPIPERKFELVLSPSERVKMNKRSCKKTTDPFSPVWVKKTVKTKQKISSDVAPDVKTATEEKQTKKIGRKPLFKKSKDDACSKSGGVSAKRKRSDSECDSEIKQKISRKANYVDIKKCGKGDKCKTKEVKGKSSKTNTDHVNTVKRNVKKR